MVSHHVFYPLALLAIIWLFVILHLTGSKPGLTTPLVAAKPKRTRSTAPKPFAGLTHKPHCALCERETGATPLAPPRQPDPMPPTNRRPRTVDPAAEPLWMTRSLWHLGHVCTKCSPAAGVALQSARGISQSSDENTTTLWLKLSWTLGLDVLAFGLIVCGKLLIYCL
jgi:hypothetical protein